MRVIVCGAGVIGAATAYCLTGRGSDVTIVERWRVAGCASGKSGGFLARDWCDATPAAALATYSFDRHEMWADELGNPYGYRKLDTYSAALSARRDVATSVGSDHVTWLAEGAGHRRRLGSTATTAQLDPQLFTETLVNAAMSRGARLVFAAVAGLTTSVDGSRVTGVASAAGDKLEADAVVLAIGPWSLLAARWLPLPAIYGLKGHSVIFKPDQALPPQAIFAEFEDADGQILTPEIVPRADGTLYVCGLSGDAPLPIDPAQVAPEPGGCERLRDAAVRLVPQLAGADVIAEQACYRPVTGDGMPIIGPIGGCDGVYVATGHSVWGMLNATGTGEAVADLILSGTSKAVDLTPFRADRLAVLDPQNLDVRQSRLNGNRSSSDGSGGSGNSV